MADSDGVARQKAVILDKLSQGWTIRRSMDFVEKSEKLFEYYKRNDQSFADEVAKIRRKLSGEAPPPVPDFPEFCETYLGMKLFNHQLQWFDLIEGRRPRSLHDSQVYTKGEQKFRRMYVCNTPPDHAKTTTISTAYVVWRIVKNPNIRVLIISKTQDLAKDILSSIKMCVDEQLPGYEDLKNEFAPACGWHGQSKDWRTDRIKLDPTLITREGVDKKDATVQAKGIGQQIYGKRAELIIMDDCIDLANVHEFEKNIKWTQKEVQSRLILGIGALLIVGTRLASQDFYSELMRPDRYPKGTPPYTYLSQPAVLEMAEDPEDWVVLWPKSNIANQDLDDADAQVQDSEGLYDHFTGPYFDEIRGGLSPTDWAMVYMQQQVNDNSTFTLDMLNGCTNSLRIPGLMKPGQRGHRPQGMAGMYIIGGLDPAAVNYTAAVCYAVDRSTGKRFIIDVWNKFGAIASEANAMMKAWTSFYGINEWVIETNAYQQSILQDHDLVTWMRARGTVIGPHITGTNKWDPQWGVGTLSNLFRGAEHDMNMIELPNRNNHPGMQALYEQLITWYPTPAQNKAPTQDTVMALWFCELRARTWVQRATTNNYVPSKWRTARDEAKRMTVNLDWLASRQQAGIPAEAVWDD